MRERMVWILLVVVVGAFMLAGCAGGGSPSAAPSGAGSGASQTSEGQTLVETKCKMCHSLDRINSAQKTPEEWETTVSRMQRNGLVVTEAEKSAILDYLSK